MNTRQINYFDHEQIEYIYSADGTKLRAIYRPASSNALTDSTDYVGSLILKNGQPSMYMFDGGFVTFSSTGAIGSSRMHYYIQDYMGNNRMVVNRTGTTEQITHYYPYGGVIGDISTNESVQKYKFEGPRSHQKEIDNLLARRRAFRRGVELDRTFGLDNYDIHARQYFAMMPSWDRIDPQAENIFAGSPYLYCGGDPVNFGDYNGCDYWSTSNPEEIKQFLYEYNSGLGFCNFNFDGWLHTSDIDFINGLSYNDESNYYYFTKPFVDDDAFGISCKVFSNKWLLSSEGLVFETLEYGIKDFYKNFWNKQKTTYKSQIAYDILKRFPYKVNTKPSTVYNKIIPNTIAKIGKGVGGIGACISLRNIYSNVSNNNYLGVGDATSLAIVGIGLFASSSISVPVCVLYMVSDLITYGITSKTIDEHLNNKWHIDLPE